MCSLPANDIVSVTLEERTFLPSTATIPQCWNVTIINDDTVENIETLSVQLSTNDLNVVLRSPSTSLISILDDDSE